MTESVDVNAVINEILVAHAQLVKENAVLKVRVKDLQSLLDSQSSLPEGYQV